MLKYCKERYVRGSGRGSSRHGGAGHQDGRHGERQHERRAAPRAGAGVGHLHLHLGHLEDGQQQVRVQLGVVRVYLVADVLQRTRALLLRTQSRTIAISSSTIHYIKVITRELRWFRQMEEQTNNTHVFSIQPLYLNRGPQIKLGTRARIKRQMDTDRALYCYNTREIQKMRRRQREISLKRLTNLNCLTRFSTQSLLGQRLQITDFPTIAQPYITGLSMCNTDLSGILIPSQLRIKFLGRYLITFFYSSTFQELPIYFFQTFELSAFHNNYNTISLV